MARAALTCRICTQAAVTKLVVSLGGPAHAEGHAFTVPSGQGVEFYQKIEAESDRSDSVGHGTSTHFRFVAPALSRDQAYEVVSQDLMYLCNHFAAPNLSEAEQIAGADVVISLAKAPSEFGSVTPDIPKFFESFSVERGVCHWGDF